jgi:5-methylcytosine-specific restriction endonuclease McrA
MKGFSRFREAHIRRCERCSKELYRKQYGDRLESESAFEKRRFCSPKCANMRDFLTKQGYSLRGRAHMGKFCEACGDRDAALLDIHHLDQNHEHNEPDNLQTLCSRCHDFWHTTNNCLNRFPAGRMPKLFESFESLGGVGA